MQQQQADDQMKQMAMQQQMDKETHDYEEKMAPTQGVLKAIGQIPKEKRTSGDTKKIRDVAARMAKMKPNNK